MRITYVFDVPLPDTGADTEQVVNTASALARQGHQVTLLIPARADGAGDAARLRDYYHVTGDFTVRHLPLRYRGLRLLEKWSHALRARRDPAVHQAQVVYTRNLPAAGVMLRAGHRVVYEHFRPWGDQVPPLQPYLRWVLRHPRLVGAVFHSAFARDSYLRLGVPAERLLVAHNGWDPARMEPRLTREAARARLGLPAGGFTVAYSGRLNRRKGLEVLLAAARAAPEIGFVLIGSEGEGPVEREAAGLPNVRVVPWLGFGELAPWLYAADALVIPPSLAPLARHGNTVLPIKLFLYLAAGRALVAPVAPDTAELLADGRNARLIPPGDPAGLVSALRELAADPARTARLAAGALETAAGLTWEARAGHIGKFLSGRLAAPPPPSLPTPDPWSAPRWLGASVRWLFRIP
jgi:glycosyltransferase involved in cell wall biosynthesis